MTKKTRSAATRTRQQAENAQRTAHSVGLEATITATEWRATLETCEQRCLYCEAQGILIELAHAIPTERGGPATKANCIPACRSCNRCKGVDDPMSERYWVGLPPGARERLWAFWDLVGGAPEPGPWEPKHYRLLVGGNTCGAPSDQSFTRSPKFVTCNGCVELLPPRRSYRPGYL